MLLVLNTGSSSIKLAVYRRDLSVVVTGDVDGVGGMATLTLGAHEAQVKATTHADGIAAMLDALRDQGIDADDISAAAHRVVHGGAVLTRPMRLTDEAIATIEVMVPLAPLHNPPALAGIRALQDLHPNMPQFASFDTAFHATNPDVAQRYALPSEIEAMGIRRYGFHGLSYAGLSARLPGIIGADMPGRVLAFHLGNGASICAMAEGRSVATSMGYSPLEGLTMGSRTGNIDGNAVLRMAEEMGIERASRILNKESGLKGLAGGVSDMRTLLASDDAESAFAVDHFCYWALRHAGSLMAALGGLDAVVFTGGIGENAAPIRARIMQGLEWAGLRPDADRNAAGDTRLHQDGSDVTAWIVPADEERVIAGDALALLEAE